MLVKVSRQHIKKGCRISSSHCPVALAVRAANPKAVYVAVSSMIVIDDKMWNIPDYVQDWVQKFDTGEHVEPFEFTIGEP